MGSRTGQAYIAEARAGHKHSQQDSEKERHRGRTSSRVRPAQLGQPTAGPGPATWEEGGREADSYIASTQHEGPPPSSHAPLTPPAATPSPSVFAIVLDSVIHPHVQSIVLLMKLHTSVVMAAYMRSEGKDGSDGR